MTPMMKSLVAALAGPQHQQTAIHGAKILFATLTLAVSARPGLSLMLGSLAMIKHAQLPEHSRSQVAT